MIIPKFENIKYLGNIDGVVTNSGRVLLNGWVSNTEEEDKPVQILLINEGIVVGNGLADIERHDVRNAGVKNLLTGFSIHIDKKCISRKIDICTKAKDGSIEKIGSCFIETGIEIIETELNLNIVKSVFNLLFNRDPENTQAVTEQMIAHKKTKNFIIEMFRSPEFYEKNTDLIDLVKIKLNRDEMK